MMSALDLDMVSFWSESLNVLIFFGSDRSFDVNPVGAESNSFKHMMKMSASKQIIQNSTEG